MILDNLPKDIAEGSHKIFRVSCDSGKHPKCLGIIDREYRIIYKQRQRTGGKDFCKFCQKREEFSGRNNPNTRYYFNDNYLENIDTPEKAYLLGWIASDGSIWQNSVSIFIKEIDVDTLVYLKSLISRDLPICEKDNNLLGITINSHKFAQDCLKHLQLDTFGKKHDLVKFPEISNDLKPYFIRGYFEGDGYVGVKSGIPRVSIYSNSSSMLHSIKDITNVGYVYSNSFEINKGLDAIKFLEYIYSGDGADVLHRKFNTYVDIKGWVPSLSYNFTSFDGFKVKINKVDPNAVIPKVALEGDAGLDLTIIRKGKLLYKDVYMYHTGLKVSPPAGYYFDLVPRSSLSKSGHSLANSVGIIDSQYVGEIMVAIRSHTEEELPLPFKGFQLILRKYEPIFTVEVDSLEDTARGEGGFGSTGS
jgi:dUTP pyrophosphatase